MFDSAAAGDLHTHHCQALNIIARDDFGQLLRIIAVIQLGAPDQSDPVPDKLIMKISVCICGAVRSD